MEVRKLGIIRRGWMLKITRKANEEVVFKLSGRMGAEDIGELEKLISAETSGRRVVLDLKDLTLVDQDVVNFLRRSEVDSIQLKNCPAYIREWITGEVR
jgi:anti-anti-sigma regulatory factor